MADCSQPVCRFEEKINEMYSDIKVLVAEFKTMNGKLLETKNKIDEHQKDSYLYRKKIDELWAGVHFAKWIILLLFGTGLFFNIINQWTR